MRNYTVLELREIIKNAKRSNKTCVSYSKMKKSELYKHAQNLGLIEGVQPKIVKPKGEEDKLHDRLKVLYKKTMILKPVTREGEKNKKYILEKIRRMKDFWENLSLKKKYSGLIRLEKKYNSTYKV